MELPEDFQELIIQLEIDLSQAREKLHADIVRRIRKNKKYSKLPQDGISAIVENDIASITHDDVLEEFAFATASAAVREYSVAVHSNVQRALLDHVKSNSECRQLIERALEHDRTWVLGSLGQFQSRDRKVLPLTDFLAFCYLLGQQPASVLPDVRELSDLVMLHLMNCINSLLDSPLPPLEMTAFTQDSYDARWDQIYQLADLSMTYYEGILHSALGTQA